MEKKENKMQQRKDSQEKEMPLWGRIKKKGDTMNGRVNFFRNRIYL